MACTGVRIHLSASEKREMKARALVRNSSKDNLELEGQAYGYPYGRMSSLIIAAEVIRTWYTVV